VSTRPLTLAAVCCAALEGCTLDESGAYDAGNDVFTADTSIDAADGGQSDVSSDSADAEETADAQDGGFTPPTFAGLVLWLRADLGLTFNGNNITTWRDQSSNAFDLDKQDGTNAYAVSGAPNGTPAIAFSSGSLYRSAPLISGADAPRTMCIVLQPSLLTGEMAVLQDGPVTTNGIGYYLNGSSPWVRAILLTNVLFETDTASATGTNWEQVCVINMGASQQRLRVGGTEHVLSTSNLTPSAATTHFSLGGAHGAAYHFHGNIAETIVYNRVLSTQEQLQLEAYLTARYGL